MEKIILVGGGGHCASCIDVIEQEQRFEIVGIIDTADRKGTTLLGYPVIGCDEEIPRLAETCRNFLITLGQIRSPQRRIALFFRLEELGANIPAIISPQAYVSQHATVGRGTIVMHNAIVNANACIGINGILNSRCLIEHDARIGDNCHISTGAIVNGGTQVAKDTFIGSGTVLRDNIRIGPGTLVGAGLRIMRDLPKESTITS